MDICRSRFLLWETDVKEFCAKFMIRKKSPYQKCLVLKLFGKKLTSKATFMKQTFQYLLKVVFCLITQVCSTGTESRNVTKVQE